jgi:hypothetical protein
MPDARRCRLGTGDPNWYRGWVRGASVTTQRVAGVGVVVIVLLGLIVQPLATAGALLIVGAVVLLVRWPYAALVLFFALVPFHHLGYEYGTNKLHLHLGPLVYWKETLLIGLLVRGVQMRAHARGGLRLPGSGADRFLVAYVLVLLMWATMSPFARPAFTSFIRTAEGPLMVLAITALRPSRRVILQCLAVMLAGAFIMGGAAVVEQAFKHSFQSWYGFNTDSEVFYSHILTQTGYRSGSFLGDSLVLGFYLSGATSMAVGGVLLARGWLRAAAILVFCACIAGTIATFTRSALVAVPLGVVITVALALPKSTLRAASAGLTVTAVVLVGGLFIASGSQRFSHGGDSTSHFQELRSAFDQSTQHPLGFGLGTTDYVAHQFNIEGYVGQSVDSVYGDRLVEGGVVILALDLLALFSTGYRVGAARARARRDGDWSGAVLASAALGAFVAVAAAGVFLPVQEQPVTLTCWGSAGLALAMVDRRGDPSARAVRWSGSDDLLTSRPR